MFNRISRRVFSKKYLPVKPYFEMRGNLSNATHETLSSELWTEKAIHSGYSVYSGFDPTSNRLHLGNLVQIVSLVRASLTGLRPIALVGGATGMIGDPSGKTSERSLLDLQVIIDNKRDVSNNIQELFFSIAKVAAAREEENINKGILQEIKGFEIVDNYEFYKDMNVLEFLTKIGKFFNISMLLNRHTIASRLESGDGISYTEFSYQLLQGYDFLKLFKDKNCRLQLGGSDQYGNICSGIDLVRRIEGEQVSGLTTNLLLTADGHKFGKSEGNAIWASTDSESLLNCHQYLMNVSDSEVVQLLKSLTFIDMERIHELEQSQNYILMKEILSREVLWMISGSQEKADSVFNYTKYFSISFEELASRSESSLQSEFSTYLNHFKMSSDEFASFTSVAELIVKLGLKPSLTQATKLIKAKGLSINGIKVTVDSIHPSSYSRIKGRIWIIKYGKKDFANLVIF